MANVAKTLCTIIKERAEKPEGRTCLLEDWQHWRLSCGWWWAWRVFPQSLSVVSRECCCGAFSSACQHKRWARPVVWGLQANRVLTLATGDPPSEFLFPSVSRGTSPCSRIPPTGIHRTPSTWSLGSFYREQSGVLSHGVKGRTVPLSPWHLPSSLASLQWHKP